jgi:hypothetical protein
MEPPPFGYMGIEAVLLFTRGARFMASHDATANALTALVMERKGKVTPNTRDFVVALLTPTPNRRRRSDFAQCTELF